MQLCIRTFAFSVRAVS